ISSARATPAVPAAATSATTRPRPRPLVRIKEASMDYFPGGAAGGVAADGPGGTGWVTDDGAGPGLGAVDSAGFSGWTCVTLHSIAARFSSGVVGPPFSKPLQSTLAILPSPAMNAWFPRAVNVYFERYSNTP